MSMVTEMHIDVGSPYYKHCFACWYKSVQTELM